MSRATAAQIAADRSRKKKRPKPKPAPTSGSDKAIIPSTKVIIRSVPGPQIP